MNRAWSCNQGPLEYTKGFHHGARWPGQGAGTRGRQSVKEGKLVNRFRWEDVVWMLILSALATLWIVLLTSPTWR